MYIETNTDNWLFGERLIGECKCNPDKVIKLVYLGDNRWKFPKVVSGSDTWSFNPIGNYDISESGIPIEYKLSEYHRWRRVPKGGIDRSEIAKPTPCKCSTPHWEINDYEIGDRIRIRGFEYEIMYDGEVLGGAWISKVEPPQKKINDRLKEINKEIQDLIREVEDYDN